MDITVVPLSINDSQDELQDLFKQLTYNVPHKLDNMLRCN